MTPEELARIQVLRDKARNNTLTMEETKEAIALLRSGRAAASQTAAKSSSKRASAKAPAKSGDDLLSELEAI